MRSHILCILFSLLISGSIARGAGTESPPDTGFFQDISDFLARGDGGGSVGAAVNYQNNRNALPNPGLAWGYLSANYLTPDWNGLTFGARALGVSQIWENNPGDYETDFTDDWIVRNLYLSYEFNDSSSSVMAGRNAYSGNPILDGDSQEGAGITIAESETITFWGAAFHRWVNNASVKYDADGISGWTGVSDANADAGEIFLTGRIDAQIGDQLLLSPFAGWQENVLAVYGIHGIHTLPLSNDRKSASWQSELILTYYDNQTPSSINADYGNLWVGRLHTGYESASWSAGAGFYWLGDNALDTTAGLFNAFDPLKEDDLYPLNDQNDAYLFYLNGSLTLGSFVLEPAIGLGRNDAVAADSLEINFLFTWDLPGNFEAAGYLVHVDFTKDVLPNYTVGGVSLAYDF